MRRDLDIDLVFPIKDRGIVLADVSESRGAV